MKSDSSSLAKTFLASTRRYLELPHDPMERHRAFIQLQAEWKDLFKRLLQHAEDKGPEDWFAIGHGYSNGWGAERDRVAAQAWFRRAAEAGHSEAMVRLAFNLTHPDREHEWQEGNEWLRRSSEMGNASAMVHLGFAYRDGRGVETDLDLAEMWFAKAYEAGDLHAAVHVGRLLLCYEEKPLEAALWFHLAADAGQSESYLYLAMLYDDRQSGMFDAEKAVYWYHRVVKDGKGTVPRAMLELARHYRDGAGVSADRAIAKSWTERLLAVAQKGSEFHRAGLKLRDELDTGLL